MSQKILVATSAIYNIRQDESIIDRKRQHLSSLYKHVEIVSDHGRKWLLSFTKNREVFDTLRRG